MIEPTPRPEVFDTYWRFAAERQAIFMRRIRGEPAPWTTDPILHDHKFCCTYRAADRVSQYVIRQLYADPSAGKADLVFRALALRTFSRPATWERLTEILTDQPSIKDLQDGSFQAALDLVADEGKGLYTSAFILPSGTSSFGSERKHRNHAALFERMFIADEAGDAIPEAGSLEAVYEILRGFPMMGDFLAYQVAIDINYSPATDFSENDFVQAGPGAVRGLEKVFRGLNGWSPKRTILWMVEQQRAQFDRLGLDFPGLWGRPLHGIDAQGLFCETDKYSRVAFPELASNRTRIKAKFTPTREPLTLFFPPKWGLNDKVPQHAVLGAGAPAPGDTWCSAVDDGQPCRRDAATPNGLWCLRHAPMRRRSA